MNWEAILAGLGAVLTGAGGCTLVIHEFRRRDRAALKDEVDELSADVSVLRVNLIACRRYAFQLAEEMAGHGIVVEAPPELQKGALDDD